MFEGLLQPTHLLLIFFIALLVFGPKKIPDLGKSLGESIREFKKAIAQDDERTDSAAETPEQKSELKRLP
jgi:sec-independent protein translocase protein TatA